MVRAAYSINRYGIVLLVIWRFFMSQTTPLKIWRANVNSTRVRLSHPYHLNESTFIFFFGGGGGGAQE